MCPCVIRRGGDIFCCATKPNQRGALQIQPDSECFVGKREICTILEGKIDVVLYAFSY